MIYDVTAHNDIPPSICLIYFIYIILFVIYLFIYPMCVYVQVYLKEAPWPSAQAEIRTINAYKTPRDKVQCILRMCSTIMNLLSLANEDAVPGADDFVPVLVFVLIKVSTETQTLTVLIVCCAFCSMLIIADSMKPQKHVL